MSKKITNIYDLTGKKLSGWTVLSLFIIKSETQGENGVKTKILFTKEEEVVAVTEFSFSTIRDVSDWNIKPRHILAIVRRDGFGFCLENQFKLNGLPLRVMTESSIKKIRKDRLYTKFKWSER